MIVYRKLQEARIDLQSKPLKKSGKNNFAGYQYFELADFLPSIQQICLDRGLCGSVTFYTDIAVLTITDVDKPEDKIEFKCPMSSAALKGCHEVQNLGAVQTYLRRYLYTNAFEIVEHDALDATMGKDEPKKAKPTVESPRIVGERTQWQEDPSGWIIDAPADPIGQDVQGWLELIKNSTYLFLGMCNMPDDVLSIFKKNKTLFDTVKLTDPQFFTEMMTKFTEVKTKLEKEAV